MKMTDLKTGEPVLGDDGQPVMSVITGRKIKQEWAPFEAERAEAVEYARNRARSAMDARQRTLSRIKGALGGIETMDADGMPYSVRGIETVYGDGSYSRDVSMPLTDLAAILEAAHEAGRREAR